MADVPTITCCPVVVPSVRVTVDASSPGCLSTVPRDLEGDGPVVDFFVFIAEEGQTGFDGIDSQGKFFDANVDSSFITVNGSLITSTDYSLTSSQLVLYKGCYEGDIVAIQSFSRSEESPESRSLEDRITRLEILLASFVEFKNK